MCFLSWNPNKKKFDILLEELNLSLNECTIIINSEYIYLYKYVTVNKVSRLIYKFKKSSVVFYFIYNLKIMKKQKKTLFQRFIYGVKLAWNLPSLPTSVDKFNNYPLIRIFRVIRGISILLFLSSPGWINNSFYLKWIIFVLAMIQFLYIAVISIIKIGYIVYLWKNKKLEVRNSPIDLIASLTLILATCIKGACVAGGVGATVLGLGFGADMLLEEAGYPPFFKKAVGNQLSNILSGLGYTGNAEYLELQKRMLDIKQKAKNIEELNRIVDNMEKDPSFSELKSELAEFKREFIKDLQREKTQKAIEQSKILAELKNIKKKW